MLVRAAMRHAKALEAKGDLPSGLGGLTLDEAAVSPLSARIFLLVAVNG
jgi:hypothetical protein